MKQELVDFKDIISSLQLLSKKVVPLPQRKAKLKSKLPVEPVCSYKNMQVTVHNQITFYGMLINVIVFK